MVTIVACSEICQLGAALTRAGGRTDRSTFYVLLTVHLSIIFVNKPT